MRRLCLGGGAAVDAPARRVAATAAPERTLSRSGYSTVTAVP